MTVLDPGALPSDTSPEAAQVLLEGYRSMSPSEKLERVFSMNGTLRTLQEARLRLELGPSASEERIRCERAARSYGRDLAERASPQGPAQTVS